MGGELFKSFFFKKTLAYSLITVILNSYTFFSITLYVIL